MSSVLKALKRQSSPLLSSPSQVALESAENTTYNYNQPLLVLVIVVAALTVGWGATKVALSTQQDVDISASDEVTHYALGEVASIKQPQWPEPVVEIRAKSEANTTAESGRAIRSAAQNQAERDAIVQNQAIDLNQISPELLSAFENAVSDSGGKGSVVPALSQLSPDFKGRVPSFSYDGHQYSSRPEARWVELAGVRLFEGERWRGLTIIAIAPAHVVLSLDQQAFQQPALEDWTTP